jgi:hypothetical protein
MSCEKRSAAHSITSSARARSVDGRDNPSANAVFVFIANVNRVSRSNGKPTWPLAVTGAAARPASQKPCIDVGARMREVALFPERSAIRAPDVME